MGQPKSNNSSKEWLSAGVKFIVIVSVCYVLFMLITFAVKLISWNLFSVLLSIVAVFGVMVYYFIRPQILKDYVSRKMDQVDVREFQPRTSDSMSTIPTSFLSTLPRPTFVAAHFDIRQFVDKYSRGLLVPSIVWLILFVILGFGFGGDVTLISFFLTPDEQLLFGFSLFAMTCLIYYGFYSFVRRRVVNNAQAAKFNDILSNLLQDLMARTQQNPLVELEAVCQDHGISYDTFVRKIGEVKYPYLYQMGDLDLNSKWYILKPQYIKQEVIEEHVTAELQTEFRAEGRINLTQFARKIGFDFERMQRILYQYAGKNHIRGCSEINQKGEYLVSFERGTDPQLIAELDQFFRSALEAEISGAGKKQGGKV